MARKRSNLPFKLPKYAYRSAARGKEYFYFQRHKGTPRKGPWIRLPHPADPAFWDAYYAALGERIVVVHQRGSFAALITEFKSSPEWTALSASTKRDYARYLELIAKLWGDIPVANLTSKAALALRDKFQAKPATANATLRALSSLISWSIPRGYRDDNPVRSVKKLKTASKDTGGWRAWHPEQIDIAEAKLPRPLWWAVAVAVYTGQRQHDCMKMLRAKLKNGTITVKQEKTRLELEIPIHPRLQRVLDEIPATSTHLLVNSHGRPWTQDGFRSSFYKAILEIPELAGLQFHGLRKSAVEFLLEAGCTDAEVESITGQSRQTIAHYAKRVNRTKLAKVAMDKWQSRTVPTDTTDTD